MESKVNYTVVGVFVLMLGIGLIAAMLWLGSGKQFGKRYDTYLVYMGESVSGLALNAPVRYRGVDVGSVRAIGLDPTDSERVRLTLDIERNTPVKIDSVAVLRTQGLTGIAYVDLMGGSREAPLLQPQGTERYPVIQSAPSLMARLDLALPGLLANLERIAESLSAALDEENRRALKQMLNDLAEVSRTLAARGETIDAGIRDTARTMANVARASAALAGLVERMDRAAAEVARLTANASKVVEDNREGLRQFGSATLPELHALIGEMREVANSLRQTARQIERDPAVLLHGKPAARPGPGE